MSIHKKILEFQKTGVTLKKEGNNPHFNSSYVTLNEVLDKVKEPLNKLGILILQTSEATGLRTILKDTEDDTFVECFMPYTETSTAQKLGSNLTYLRRYSLVTLLGLGDEDDDGNQASEPRASRPIFPQAPATPARATQGFLATDKQKSFIKSLMTERNLIIPSDTYFQTLGMAEAKKKIDSLLALPRQDEATISQDAPVGEYGEQE